MPAGGTLYIYNISTLICSSGKMLDSQQTLVKLPLPFFLTCLKASTRTLKLSDLAQFKMLFLSQKFVYTLQIAYMRGCLFHQAILLPPCLLEGLNLKSLCHKGKSSWQNVLHGSCSLEFSLLHHRSKITQLC